jgi:thiol-disulfide isomerase/thioredoxin
MSKVVVGFVGMGFMAVVGWYLVSQPSIESAAMTADAGGVESAAMQDDIAEADTVMDDTKMVEGDKAKDGQMVKENESMMKDDTMKSDETMMKDDMMKDEVAVGQAGVYDVYDESKLAYAASGDVVLFFRASWCPGCRAIDSDIRANLSAIPNTLTILEVDYDTETALKTKYGVTTQHTFVQVNQNGTQKKWSGGTTLASIVEQVQ